MQEPLVPKVEWVDAAASERSTCPLCGVDDQKRVVLRARHWVDERGALTLVACRDCGSAFFLESGLHEQYPDDLERLKDPNFALLIHHYVELTGGLDWKVPLLESMPFERFARVLEIGCSVGAAIDYCRVAWGAHARGLEPSAYGAAGAVQFGFPVERRFIEQLPENELYDLIYATEVLEHVEDPRAFLTAIEKRLSPSGMVLITTPRAENVTRSARPGDLYATLSAGAHRFIPSRRALEGLLIDAGFLHLDWSETGNSQVLMASKGAPFERRKVTDTAARRLRYYELKLEAGVRDPRFALGLGIDAFRCAVDLGDFARAATHRDRIDAALRSDWDLDLQRPEALARRLRDVDSIFGFGAMVPFGLPHYLFARGHLDGGSHSALGGRMFAACALVCLHGLRVDFQNLFAYHAYFERALSAATTSLRHAPRPSTLRLLAEVVSVRQGLPELRHPRDRLASAVVHRLRLGV
ncbi:MAG: methyltransferase domain-containing protein [Myxococcales bacterium]|nr:methyltransferase domain-containing protein [Myxococcales bacterium]